MIARAVVFTYDGSTRSGELTESSACGCIVYGRADGRAHLIASDDMRPETEAERQRRETYGEYFEDAR